MSDSTRPAAGRRLFQCIRRRGFGAVLFAFLVAAAHAQGFTPATPERTQATAGSALDAIREWLGSRSGPDLLEPDDAFRIQVRARGGDTLVATLTPASRYYLYRDRITFAVLQPATVAISQVTLPPGEPKADPTFGSVQVFHAPFEAVIALKRSATLGGEEVHLRATYQGCNEPLGVCYPPIEKTVVVALSTGAPATRGLVPSELARADAAAADDWQIREIFRSGSSLATVAAFFGFGLLLAFTPCMLPMLPILSGIIVGTARHASRRQVLALSSVYVLGMAITYAGVGVAAGLAGTLVSAYLQSPWVLGAFAAIFVLLALSMFGLYELQLPAALQSRLARASNGCGAAAVFGMAAGRPGVGPRCD